MSKDIKNCKCSIHKAIKYLDESNAPQGFKAVNKGYSTCVGCHFEYDSQKVCNKKKCGADERQDGFSVIFIKK